MTHSSSSDLWSEETGLQTLTALVLLMLSSSYCDSGETKGSLSCPKYITELAMACA